MSTKDFVIFADATKKIQDDYKKEIVLNFLLSVLPMFSSKFNSSKFKDWINNK